MKIRVLLKIVPDTETRIKIKSDASGIDTGGIVWIINPYDEYAIEEAMKLKNLMGAGEIVSITAGPKEFNEKQIQIRKAMARGVDRAIYIADDIFAFGDGFLTAKALAKVLEQESFDIIFAGKQAVDFDNSQVPQTVASLLNIPCVSGVSKFEFKKDEKKVIVEREIEGGTKGKYELSIPCIIGAAKGLNEPRFETLPGIMQAKKKQLRVVALTDLGIDFGQVKTEVKSYSLPPSRQAGKIIEASDETDAAKKLAKLLREEARVI